MATTQVSLPGYREPWFDPSGNISRPWWLFLQGLSKVIGGGQVPDLSSILQAIRELQQNVEGQEFPLIPAELGRVISDMAELRERIETLMLPADLMRLRRKIDEIEGQMLDLPPAANLSLAGYAQLSGAAFTGPISGTTASFTGAATAAAHISTTSSVSAPTSTAVTVFAMPNTAPATYLVNCNVGAVADTTNYSAFAVVMADLGSARIAMQNNGVRQTITLSGLAIQSTQTSGATQTINTTITRIA